MFPFASLPVTLLLALSTAASPVEVRNSPVTLPIARKLNIEGGIVNVLQHDLARAASLRENKGSGSIPIINNPEIYTAKVGIGSPATTCKLRRICNKYICQLILCYRRVDYRHR